MFLALLLCLLLGLILRVGLALRFPNLYHADEIFQTQEPAHHLAYGYGVVTWEWRRGVRSWVFPAFLAGVMRATDWMGAGSDGYQLGMVLVLSLMSLTTVWFGFAWAKRACGTEAAIIAAGACATWYELIFFAPKALTEIVATDALLPGLYLGMYGERLGEKTRLFLAGIFCGLAMSLRIQLAPAVLFAAIWFCYARWRERIIPLTAGLILPVLGFGLVDKLTWSYPFQSFFRYFWVNVMEGQASQYGVMPWYWYLQMLCGLLGPIAVLVLLGIRRSTFLGWEALVILVSHSILAHKEVRFLYPLVPIAITLAVLGIIELVPVFNQGRKRPLSSRAMVISGLSFCVLCSCLLQWNFDWSRMSGSLAAFDQLSREPALCGVGVYKIDWWDIGGYSHLHRDVPIILLGDASELTGEAGSFNAVVSSGKIAGPPTGFELEGCWKGVCRYVRPGACTPPRLANEINHKLESMGK